jgi:HSP20 family protein
MTRRSGWVPDGIRDIRDGINRIFDELAEGSPGRFLTDRGWSPLLDIYREPGEVVVVAELPGFESGMLSISLTEDTLVIGGVRPEDASPGEVHTRIERNGGGFERAVSLPGPLDGDGARATFRNGLLRVVVPLLPEASPRKVTISGEDERE